MKGQYSSTAVLSAILFVIQIVAGADRNYNNYGGPKHTTTSPNIPYYSPEQYPSNNYPTSQEYNYGVQNVHYCSETFTKKVCSYYSNPHFPHADGASRAYKHLVVKNSREYKAVRIEFLEVKMAGRNLNWDPLCCTNDSFQILNSAEGATSLQCGLIKGYRYYQESVCGIKNGPASFTSSPASDEMKVTQQFPAYQKPQQTVPVPVDVTPSTTPKSSPMVQIVGGSVAFPHEFPWQVVLLVKINGFFYFICGGFIIDPWHVLTASHCTAWDGGFQNIDLFYVWVGKYNLLANEPGSQLIKVSYINQNANFLPEHDDICLLRLQRQMVFSQTVSPICLPQNPDVTYEHQKCIATGFGIDETLNVSPILKKADETIISNEGCNDIINDAVETFGPFVTPDMICGISRNASNCNGDSGGSCAYLNNVTGKYESIGITIFGFVYSNGVCAINFPNVFTRITKFLLWLSYNLALDQCGQEHEYPLPDNNY